VAINGSVVGTIPLSKPVRVNAGTADVELSATGHKRQSRTVKVHPGSLQSIVMRLDRELAPAQASADSESAVPQLPPRVDSLGQQAAAGGPLRIAKYAITGAALVAGGVAAYGYFRHEAAVADFRNKKDAQGLPRCLENGDKVVDSHGAPAMLDCLESRSSYRAAKTTMIIGGVASLALGAGAAVLWLLDVHRAPTRLEDRAHEHRLRVLLSPGRAVLVTSWGF
jgi:hypothetical protein